MKRVVKLRVYVDSDRITHVVMDAGRIQHMVTLIRPDGLDYVRGDTMYAKCVEGTFTYDDGEPAKKGARK